MQESQQASLKRYQDLLVWQKAMDLTVAIYEATKEWPSAERFSLVDQIRRAAVSVPANVAEGDGRTGPREFLHHCSIAYGSMNEVETYLVLALRLQYMDQSTTTDLLNHSNEVGRMLHGLMRRLRSSSASR